MWKWGDIKGSKLGLEFMYLLTLFLTPASWTLMFLRPISTWCIESRSWLLYLFVIKLLFIHHCEVIFLNLCLVVNPSNWDWITWLKFHLFCSGAMSDFKIQFLNKTTCQRKLMFDHGALSASSYWIPDGIQDKG